MNSEFKYPVCRIRQNGRFKQHITILQRNNGCCKCISCPICVNYYNYPIYPFFSERKREHYDELNNNVFVWLNKLHLGFPDDENPNYILENIYAVTGEDSMFYCDARRHMSRAMKRNIDNFEKSLDDCNNHIHSVNIMIDNRIKEIVKRPVFGTLTNNQISSIYRILKIGFSQAIKGKDNISDTIKKWDLTAKVKTYDFSNQSDIDNGKNILATIQQDQIVIDKILELKSKLIDLEKQKDIIKNQSNEISSRIAAHRHIGKRRCCPSLIKELWNTLF